MLIKIIIKYIIHCGQYHSHVQFCFIQKVIMINNNKQQKKIMKYDIDTVMTEKMDYYSAVISIMFGLYVAIVRVFEIRTKKKQIIIGTILMMYLTYHLYYMNYVSFDYGYNQTVVIIVGITHSLLWCYWCFRYRYPHMKINLITQCGMWLLSLLELIDFPPLFGYMDAHSLWHGFSIFVTYLWFQFVTADAIFLLKKTKSM